VGEWVLRILWSGKSKDRYWVYGGRPITTTRVFMSTGRCQIHAAGDAQSGE
jgi:hypothetical protein